MKKWIAPLERAGKGDHKNGMVRYDSVKSSRDMKDGKLMKRQKNAESAK